MTNQEEIAALNAEARRRGTSYGKLAAALPWEERTEIQHRFRVERERKNKKQRKKKEGQSPVKTVKRAGNEPVRK